MGKLTEFVGRDRSGKRRETEATEPADQRPDREAAAPVLRGETLTKYHGELRGAATDAIATLLRPVPPHYGIRSACAERLRAALEALRG